MSVDSWDFVVRLSDRDRLCAATRTTIHQRLYVLHAVEPLPDIGQMTIHKGANLRHSTNFANMSILVDTNVVPGLIRISPNPAVKKRADIQSVESLYFSAVGEVELRFGAAVLPLGRRRDRLIFKN